VSIFFRASRHMSDGAQESVTRDEDADEPFERLRRNSTKWSGDFDRNDQEVPNPVPHRKGGPGGRRGYSDREFFENDEDASGTDEPVSPSGKRSSSAKIRGRSAESPSTGLKDLYSYRMPRILSESELDKLPESEEESLRQCTFRPKINGAKSPAKGPEDEEEVFRRVALADVAERKRAKELVIQQAKEAELKACTFRPKISRDTAQRIAPNKKSTAKETTQRLWEDIKERDDRKKHLVKNHEEDIAIKRKILSAKERQEFVRRMQEDETERKKKYQQLLDQQGTPFVSPDEEPKEPKVVDPQRLKEIAARLHCDEGHKKRIEEAKAEAEGQLQQDCPFKPAILSNAQKLRQKWELRKQAMPIPILNNSSDPKKAVAKPAPVPPPGPASRTASRPSRDSSAHQNRSRSAPKRLSEDSGSVVPPRRDLARPETTNPAARSRSAAPRALDPRANPRSVSPNPRRVPSRPSAEPRELARASSASAVSGPHRSRIHEWAMYPTRSQTEDAARSVPHPPRRSGSSVRPPRPSFGDSRPAHRDAPRQPAPVSSAIPYEAYEHYFANRPAGMPAGAGPRRQNRWMSLETPVVKPMWTSVTRGDQHEVSSQPATLQARPTLSARGGSPGTSTTARTFTNPQDDLMYSSLERRIEDELQRRLEARGLHDPIRYY